MFSLSVDAVIVFAAVCLTPPNSHYCLSSLLLITVSDTAAGTFFTLCPTNKEKIHIITNTITHFITTFFSLTQKEYEFTLKASDSLKSDAFLLISGSR